MNKPCGVYSKALLKAWGKTAPKESFMREGLCIMLSGWADEHGTLTGDPAWLAELMPAKDQSPERMESEIQALEADGLVKRYWAPWQGKIVQWMQILNWPVMNVPEDVKWDIPWPPVRTYNGGKRGVNRG